DLLLARGEYEQVEKILAPLAGTRSAAEETRRLTLLRLYRDGPDAAWSFLRGRMATNESDEDLTRWLVLTSAASNHVVDAMGVLTRRKVPIDSTVERFLALTVLAFDANVPDADAVPAVMDLVRTANTGSEARRDRELERWVSLDLSSTGHRFISVLL